MSYTVKREQIVDDSHPVDIKATGPDLNTVSLIEIKWIGDSEKVKYRDARANEGAEQLTGYLYESEKREPNINFKGYLTVFDARRKYNKKNHYDTVEIRYRQEYLNHSKLDLIRFFYVNDFKSTNKSLYDTLNCETKSGLLPRFCFLKVSQFLGLMANLGVTPKSALNDGQNPSFKNSATKLKKLR